MKKAKRILALIGVIFLVAMYLSTLIFSLIDSPLASDLLKGSVAATILVPVVLYGFVLPPFREWPWWQKWLALRHKRYLPVSMHWQIFLSSPPRPSPVALLLVFSSGILPLIWCLSVFPHCSYASVYLLLSDCRIKFKSPALYYISLSIKIWFK